MSHLAAAAFGLVFVIAAGAGNPPAQLGTSCQCAAVTCNNGSTSAACQVTCTGQAMCSCASCTIGSRGITYLTGQNSCFCQ